MKQLTFFIIVCFAHDLFAAGKCQNIDLRDQLGPVQNQDGTGLCYAYSASELISHKLGQRVSPVDVGLQLAKRNDEKLFRKSGRTYLNKITDERDNKTAMGGHIKDALQISQDVGYCADDRIDSNDFKGSRALNNGLVNLNQLSLHQYKLDTASGSDCAKFAKIQKIFPGVSIRQLQDTANRSNVINIGANVADVACKPRLKPLQKFRFVNIRNSGRNLSSSGYDKIDLALSKGKPVGLSVFMDKLYNFGSSTISNQKRHALTLAGRKYNPSTGKCEYILKNSWGPECDRHFKVRCQNGYLFVPEDTFRTSVYLADYIE